MPLPEAKRKPADGAGPTRFQSTLVWTGIILVVMVGLLGGLFGVFNFEHGTLLAAAAYGLVGGGIYLVVSTIRDIRRDGNTRIEET